MIGFVRPQVVYVDGILCHLRDLCPFPHMVSSSREDETTKSGDNEIYIPVMKDEDIPSTDINSNQSSNGDNNEGWQIVTAPPQEASELAELLLQM